jgi:hypothetical protein
MSVVQVLFVAVCRAETSRCWCVSKQVSRIDCTSAVHFSASGEEVKIL